jgi:hypothetical protein
MSRQGWSTKIQAGVFLLKVKNGGMGSSTRGSLLPKPNSLSRFSA